MVNDGIWSKGDQTHNSPIVGCAMLQFLVQLENIPFQAAGASLGVSGFIWQLWVVVDQPISVLLSCALPPPPPPRLVFWLLLTCHAISSLLLHNCSDYIINYWAVYVCGTVQCPPPEEHAPLSKRHVFIFIDLQELDWQSRSSIFSNLCIFFFPPPFKLCSREPPTSLEAYQWFLNQENQS